MEDELRKRFLEKEWAGNTACGECPGGHDTCLRCHGIKPLVSLKCFPLERFGHQMIDQGDYKDTCVYVMIQEEMQWFLELEAERAETRRKKDVCAKDGHEPGEERIGTMHTETVAITPEYTCRRCGATYRGKKRPVKDSDLRP